MLLCILMWRFFIACIHLGVCSHLIADGQYRESLQAVIGLISHEVAKDPPVMLLHDPTSLNFGMFLLVPPFFVLKSFSLKKLGFTYNRACPFCLDDFSPRIGYFSLLCRIIFDQHVPKDHLLFGMANKFVEVIRHPPKINAISGRIQRM